MKELLPYISCVCTPEEFPEVVNSHYGEIYIVAPEGVYKHQKLSDNRHVRLKLSQIPANLEEHLLKHSTISEDNSFLPGGKIPSELYHQVVAFFRKVMEVKKSDYEAHCFILWSKEKGYYISVPKQTVSKASVSFSYDQAALPSGSIIALDIHSHNTMGAFFSGTDDNSDKKCIYYSGVIGQLDKPKHADIFRFNLFGERRKATFDEIFEEKGAKVEIDPAWLDQVEVPNYAGNRYPAMGVGTHYIDSRGRLVPVTGYGEFQSWWDKRPDQNLQGQKGKRQGRPAWEVEEDYGKFWEGLVGLDYEEINTEPDPVGKLVQELSPKEVQELARFDRIIDNSLDEEYDFTAAQYGVAAAEAMDQISAYVIDLEGKDDLLKKIMTEAYQMMTPEGQTDLATNGL